MKSIIYIRHAKSSWAQPGLRDFDRPLNDRGENDAPFMAEKLSLIQPEIQAIISSPSKRTLMTKLSFEQTFKVENTNVILDQELYHAPSYYLEETVFQLPNTLHTAAVIAHNPGMTDLANKYSPTSIDNVPTSGIFKIDFDTDEWENILLANASFKFFIYPKLYSE